MQAPIQKPEYGDFAAMKALVESLPPGRAKLALNLTGLVVQAVKNMEPAPKKRKRKKTA